MPLRDGTMCRGTLAPRDELAPVIKSNKGHPETNPDVRPFDGHNTSTNM